MAPSVAPVPSGRPPAVAAVVTMAVGAAVMVAGSLLPWVRSGGRRRSSYDVFTLVDRLGYAPGGAAGQLLRWWPLVPLLAAVAVVAAWWGWPRAGGVVAVAAGAYSTVVAWVVDRVPESQVVDIQRGPRVTVIGAVILAAGGVAAVLVGQRARQPPVRPTGRGRRGRRGARPVGRS